MPVRGYFSKRNESDLRMPRAAGDHPDSAGVAWHGAVLTGKGSVGEALCKQAPRPRSSVVGPDRYDPVLRFHLGLE